MYVLFYIYPNNRRLQTNSASALRWVVVAANDSHCVQRTHNCSVFIASVMYPNRCMLFVLLGLTCAICSADALVMPGNRMQPARWGSRPSTTLKRTERVYAQNPHTVLRGGQVGVSSATFLEQLNSKVVLRRLALLLHTFVDPVISGGLLSGGLHAITGITPLTA